jgi:perosamine synthetase
MKKNRFIPVAAPDLSGNELKYVSECIKTEWISSNGRFVPLFESKFAKFVDKKFGISTSNGTTALHLALLSVGVGQGDEVIIPDLTFVATANAVLYTGAKPIFIDSERASWCMDPGKIEKNITKRTKAIIPVHLYGHPANMFEIMEIACKHNLIVIEDAAEAHGALVGNRNVGSFGVVNVFSFFGNKTITTGEGGMLVTDDEGIMKRAKLLRDGGRDRTKNAYFHTVLGYNYAMTNLQAAVGVAQLERIDEFISKKRKIASQYKKLFKNSPVDFSPELKGFKSNYWMSSIVLRNSVKITRDEMILRLQKRGIETRPFFVPMHNIPYMKTNLDMPVAEGLAQNGINLPSGTKMSLDDVGYVAEKVIELLK